MTQRPVKLKDVQLDRFGINWPDQPDPRDDGKYVRCEWCGHSMLPYEEPWCSVNCAVSYEAELNRGRRAA